MLSDELWSSYNNITCPSSQRSASSKSFLLNTWEWVELGKNGSHQDSRSSRMADPDQEKGSPIVFRVHQFLQKVHRQLLSNCQTPIQPAKKRVNLQLVPWLKSAFNTLWDKITSTPILALPDNSKPYQVEADSSDFATGAILSLVFKSLVWSGFLTFFRRTKTLTS